MLLSARASRLQGFHVWVLCVYIYIDTCFYMYIHSISCNVCSNCIICTCYINFHGHMQRSQVAAVSRTSHDASKDAKVLMCSTMACAIDPQTLGDADIIIAGICTYNFLRKTSADSRKQTMWKNKRMKTTKARKKKKRKKNLAEKRKHPQKNTKHQKTSKTLKTHWKPKRLRKCCCPKTLKTYWKPKLLRQFGHWKIQVYSM